MTVTPETVETVKKRANNACEVCRRNKNLQLHHCLYHKMKSKPELDVEENLEYLCLICHDSGNRPQHRKDFWRRQVEHYGERHMRKWHDNLPLKIKINF